MKFNELNLHSELLESISYMGFETASPIQEMAIPEILDGNDLIACAQTGTGKTAAFLIPVINQLAQKKSKGVSALIVCPTRELAIQIDQAVQGLGYFADITSIALYGGGDGSNFEHQKASLSQGCDIVVATPGKLISHLNMGYCNFDNLQFLVLDEADRMLDMGFVDDLNKIMSFLPEDRQSLMFSATMPSKIRQLAKMGMKNPKEVSIAISKPAENVFQGIYLVYDSQKIPLIKYIVDNKSDFQSFLVFSSTKKNVSNIVRALKNNKYSVEGISSDVEQREREDILMRFAAKKTRVLVATDVLSRGIDIKDIDLVFNYTVPKEAEDYVHRIGRTARAQSNGVALTLVNQEEMSDFDKIEKATESTVKRMPLPPELGDGPEWKLTERKKHKGNFKGNRKGGKRFNKPKKKN